MRLFRYMLLFTLLAGYSFAQTGPADNDSTVTANEAIDIYLDCDACDDNFVRMHIPYVNYVRDPQTAQVIIKVVHQNTGSGGRKYSLSFIGRQDYSEINQKLQYISTQLDSRHEERRGLTHTLQMGLMPYLSQTPMASAFKIKLDQTDEVYIEPNDPWNNWTFHLELSGDYEAEETQNKLSLTGGVRANQTTEDIKVRSRLKYDYELEEIDDDDKTVKSILRELETDIKVVKSVNEKWSYGANLGINSTTFRNIDFAVSLAPAIEYNFYPWSRSDHRVAALSYFIGGKKLDYIERTIFGKTSEAIFFQGVALQFEVVEPWWEVFANVYSSHLLNDFEKNKIELDTSISLKILEGFSLFMNLNVERPHDQIYLPQEGATRDEILLKRKKLATDYELKIRFGIQYSFGSIYNSIVNRRL